MTAYYNEIDQYAAQWLRNLIAAGHIAPGDVDDRSISDVRPSDLAGYTQCHFFAGIGGWSLALRLAGWPDDRRVWTGSCPCQPFSVAGQGHGVVDERHLWPHWFHLVRALRPQTVFGEQVEAAVNHGWLDLVQDDLEGEGYAFAPVGIPAAGVGAPHIRQRLWFVADADHQRLGEAGSPVTRERVGIECSLDQLADQQSIGLERRRSTNIRGGNEGVCSGVTGPWSNGSHDQLAHHHPGPQGREPVRQRTLECAVGQGRVAGELAEPQGQQHHGGRDSRGGWRELADGGPNGELGDSSVHGHPTDQIGRATGAGEVGGGMLQPQGSGSHWTPCDWLPCRDGKWRPVEPGTFPLAHGVSNRVGRLRAYGNAIVPQVAAEVIRAYMECRPC